MQRVTIILLGLAILAYASTWSSNKTQPSRFQHLKGWQKIFGVLAVSFALLVVLNPEFLALGLIGDTAFFDMLVLAMSLQLHVFFRGPSTFALTWCPEGCGRWEFRVR